ncbi:hypothetical protein AJ80_04611 [Polytolypa hystricis UAMH7299]|uniref:Uncharacterized protein n=1 Tax=Polytolypa hystricis (strain UAMH7299) TaxID=1447883 RepID=A0A2B7Y9W5_POLH7|nr:hypothetical protein AJ80_04611 [Polytolypa hystricis UAMH7299]
MRSHLLLLSLIARFASCAVEFTAPGAGEVLKAGDTITVEWHHVGNSTQVPGDILYDLFLCAGGNEEGSYEQLSQIVSQGLLANTKSASILVDASLGGSEQNAYFLRMSANYDASLEIIHSSRFTLSDMTGSFSETVANGLRDISSSSTEPPPVDSDIQKRQAAAAAAAAQGYTIPFGQQTGLTRYAPVATLPPTKITKKDPTRLFPTSAFDIAKSHLPKPTIKATVSVPLPSTVKSIENPASPAPHPDEEMQRYLNRWKD